MPSPQEKIQPVYIQKQNFDINMGNCKRFGYIEKNKKFTKIQKYYEKQLNSLINEQKSTNFEKSIVLSKLPEKIKLGKRSKSSQEFGKSTFNYFDRKVAAKINENEKIEVEVEAVNSLTNQISEYKTNSNENSIYELEKSNIILAIPNENTPIFSPQIQTQTENIPNFQNYYSETIKELALCNKNEKYRKILIQEAIKMKEIEQKNEEIKQKLTKIYENHI